MLELGKRAFFFRGGPYDFSCASCHAEPGKRIRALPIGKPLEAYGHVLRPLRFRRI